MNDPRQVKESELQIPVSAGAICSVIVERVWGTDDARVLSGGDGWPVRLRFGMADAVIGSHQRPVRTWGSLDILGRWLERHGIGHWEVRST